MAEEKTEHRIRELEDALKAAERRSAEIKAERDEAYRITEEINENLDDSAALIERWIEAFNMQLGDDGKWRFQEHAHDLYDALLEKHRDLVSRWNRFVPKYNAIVQPRTAGRPLDASDAQCALVRKLRKRNVSLRDIAEQTSLGLRTVRTIIDRENRTDRGTIKRFEKFDPMNPAFLAAKTRKRTRDALPDRINKLQAQTAALKKAAKGLA